MLGDNFVNKKIGFKDVISPAWGLSVYSFITKDLPVLRFNQAKQAILYPGYWAVTIFFKNIKTNEEFELEYIANFYSTYNDQSSYIVTILKEWVSQNEWDLDINDISGTTWTASFMIRKLFNSEIDKLKALDVVFEDATDVEGLYVDFHIPRKAELEHLTILNHKPDYAACFNLANRKKKK